MDINKMIELAEYTLARPDPEPVVKLDDMGSIVSYHATLIDRDRCRLVLAMRDEYEAKLKAERSRVIAEVREIISEVARDLTYSETRAIDYVLPEYLKLRTAINRRLDSMEPDKSDGEDWECYSEAKDELSEMERLAEIGRATKKAFESGFYCCFLKPIGGWNHDLARTCNTPYDIVKWGDEGCK